MNPHVESFFHRDSSTWSYVVRDAGSRAAAIIDPVLDYDAASGRTSTRSAQALVDHIDAHGLAVEWLLETHAHADHLSAAHWLKRTHYREARIAIGKGITRVQQTFRDLFDLGEDFPVDGSQFDHLFEEDETFAIGGVSGRVIPVPGHTSDSNAFLIGDALFTGDSLFMPDGGTARCDFPGGDAATLYRSIQRMYTLPNATRVFVCHDYGPGGRDFRCQTSIGEQKRANVHVRADTPEAEFVGKRESRDATLEMPRLILPSVQVNIRAGALPPREDNGVRYLKIPLDML